MKNKKRLKIAGWLLFISIFLCGITYFIAWKSPEYYTVSTTAADSIIPFADYERLINHQRPYIVTATNKYCIFGAEHTRDPYFFEIAILEQEWKTLNPTIALVEGRLGFLISGLMDPVKKLGEGGKVKALAQKNDVPLYNWDLSMETLAQQLMPKFKPEQIALAQILYPYFGQLRFGKPDSPEKYIEQYYKRAKYVRQENDISNAEDIDRLWKKYFPKDEDWRNTSDQNGLPGYLNEMAAVINDLRNRQLVSAVKELSARGERVFLHCGSSHAVCVAPAFNDAIIK